MRIGCFRASQRSASRLKIPAGERPFIGIAKTRGNLLVVTREKPDCPVGLVTRSALWQAHRIGQGTAGGTEDGGERLISAAQATQNPRGERHSNKTVLIAAGREAGSIHGEWFCGLGKHGLEHGEVAFSDETSAHSAFSIEDYGSRQLTAIVSAAN